MPLTKRRSDIVLNLASAWWHLTQEDGGLGVEDRDIRMLLLHHLRDVLRDGECPACAEIALAQDLDKAVERGEA